ncbi:arylsulfatase A-like enzyme [Catalinimonas alkaloidigena]|uniref:sulfatase-like hydrolase/transferase n=1 Tax=Catalinimonas alkaloidigena TaxID=1075417 RepID=UPI002404D041|nr:sulfatase-like hydrolase/transferase [Catalinimonas alkaloidigena]MDF9796475.1 arylsulfatase A-like enzyme [Catalinimonas alkaloidigena]
MILIRLFGLLVAFLLCRELTAQASKPNIIIVVTDDQGWSDVGFNGAKDIKTPHLDRLAAEGIIFSQGYVSHPYCSPSRAGLLTGRYQARFGHDCNPPYIENDATVGTPLTETMLSEALKENDYRTCAIGKWHLGDHSSLLPPQRGFDHWFGFSAGGMNYWGRPQGKHRTIYRNDKPVEPTELSYLTDDFSEEAVNFIIENKEEPFFMYLAYNAPHAPDQATQEYLEKTRHIEYGGRSVYAAMVAAVDAGIGKIDSTLQAHQIKENTIVVFLSDNGGRAEHANNMPYRGHKGMLFEGGIRVPFFISWPKGIKKTGIFDKPVISLDLFPTLLAASNSQPKKELALDGVNLLPFLKDTDKEAPHDILFWRSVGGFEYAVRQGKYKLYMSSYKDRTLLYNLDQDPFEHQDVASQHPEIIAELEKKYEAWNSEMLAPQWLDPHPENVEKEAERWRQTREKALPPSPRK